MRIAAVVGGALAAAYAVAWYANRRFEDLEPESAGAPGSFLDVGGERMHYVEAGDGDAVILIHGVGASTFSFRYTIPELARQYRVVALDLLGFGFSARPADGDYSLTAQAARIERVLDRLGIDRAAVVGHSLGGAVAMRLALRAPRRVSRLVLVDSATDRETRRGTRAARFLRPLFPIVVPLTLHAPLVRKFWLRTAVHDPAHVTPEVLEGMFRPTRVKGTLKAYGRLAVDRARDQPLRLEAIEQPTLILWGEHDRWLSLARGEELARRIPHARLVIVPSAGHLPLEEQPDVANRALLDFLAAGAAAVAPTTSSSATTLS